MVDKNKVGILIAVRMKSSRLRSKATALIEGKTVIAHLIERMKRVRNASKIVLCTSTHPDDQVLLEIAKKEGITGFAGSELDVMKRFIDAAQQNGFEHIVRTTGDNPLTDPKTIDDMIETHLKEGYDFTKSEFLPIGANAEVIALSALQKAYQMAEDTSLTEYMTTYLKRPDVFKVHVFENHDPFLADRLSIRLTVDYEEDLTVMNEIYGRLYRSNPAFTIQDVLKVLDQNPWIKDINANVVQIPLPKIRFKGEKVYDKQMVIVGKEAAGQVKQVIDAVKKADQFELIGFIHDSNSMQFTLVEGIPVLGSYRQLDKIDLSKAQYFVAAFEDSTERGRVASSFANRGLSQIPLDDLLK